MKLKVTFLFAVVTVITAPLLCQTANTSSLSCWDKRAGNAFQTRRAKTSVEKASAGAAYAEVVADASNDSGGAQFCKNTVQLFYASDGATYKSVYQKAGLDDQGVGIRLLGWSHNGTELLMEISVWGYDNDGEVVKSALVFDSASAQVKELPLGDAFERVFGKDCEFDSSVVGWRSDDTVLIRIGKTPSTTRYQQTFCVEKPTIYAFNLKQGKVQGGKP